MLAHAVDELEFARVSSAPHFILPNAVMFFVHLLLAQLNLRLVGHLGVQPLFRVASFGNVE